MEISAAAGTSSQSGPPSGLRPQFDRPNPIGAILFAVVLCCALYFTGTSLLADIEGAGEILPRLAILVLGGALLLALGFEFVNGFHDTANAVATVIYTRSMPPTFAVVWSGVWNFLGVVASTGAVAYSIITLLPVELILQMGSAAGYAMIFALLGAAIAWNVGTWYFGIPNSSSHCLIGSVLGVGLANQLMAPVGYATSGVDWSQAEKIGRSLFLSPMVGFIGAALLLLLIKSLARNPKLYKAPESDQPPPWWIRSILVVTCTAVSFAHGGNDGQKGMGLIMLILIGAAPAAFALNRAMSDADVPAVVRAFDDGGAVFAARAGTASVADLGAAQEIVAGALRARQVDTPEAAAALAAIAEDVGAQLKSAGSLRNVPPDETGSLRSEIYVLGEAAKLLGKSGADLSAADKAALKSVEDQVKASTRFIPDWVKFAVAFALGLGTMVGWKRIVITVGEKIGKSHLTYAQGAAAETVAAATILTAQQFGLPVSTTHVLSSGVAGTMAANGSGLRWSMVGTIASAWLFTLPVVITLSGVLYYLFMQFVR